jgi:uroporphyrinogen III methyltransferase/synthase
VKHGHLESGISTTSRKPLPGKTVLVTRAVEQSDDFSRSLEDQGATVVSFPTIAIIPPSSWGECDAAIGKLAQYEALIFTSSNAVRAFFRRLEHHQHDSMFRQLGNNVFYVIGSRTGEALVREGVTPTQFPDVADSRELAQALLALPLKGKRLLFLKGSLAGTEFADLVRAGGIGIDEATVYQTCAPSQTEAEPIKDMFKNHAIDVVTFFSPSSIRNFLEIIPVGLLLTTTIAVIGSSTAAIVREAHLAVQIIPDEPTSQKLVDAIVSYYERHHNP